MSTLGKHWKLSEETRQKFSIAHRGIKHTEASKKKMSQQRRGTKASLETRKKLSLAHHGKIPWNKGKHWSEEIKKKLSIAQKGEKGHSWRGGLTQLNHRIRVSLEYRLWRKSVFERDNYTCIWCGEKNNLHADHIKPFALFPELRFAIDNGRTLCIDCHRTTETFGGRTKIL